MAGAWSSRGQAHLPILNCTQGGKNSIQIEVSFLTGKLKFDFVYVLNLLLKNSRQSEVVSMSTNFWLLRFDVKNSNELFLKES